MKYKLTRLLSIAAILISVCLGVAAQQTGATDEKINGLKDNIQKYEAVLVKASPETQLMHRQRLKELRVELLSLLNEKRRVLRTLRAEVPETDKTFINEIEAKLRSLDTEVATTETQLAIDLAATAGPQKSSEHQKDTETAPANEVQ